MCRGHVKLKKHLSLERDGTPTLSLLVLLCKWSARKTENLEDRVRFSGEPQNSGIIVSVLPPPLQRYTEAGIVAQG